MSSNVIMLPKSKELPFSDQLESLPLFHSPDGDGYAVIEVNGHKETWPLNSTEFRNWLDFKFYEQYRDPLPITKLNEIVRSLKARAQFGSPEIPVFTRVAFYNDSIYLDLANDAWEAIAISTNGWQIDSDPPVRFIRSPSMRPLPHPVRDGSLEDLRNFINAPDDDSWVAGISWTMGAVNPKGTLPILNVEGGKGRAKTTTMRMIKDLIDPSTAPLRSPPKSVRDLMIESKNCWILAFDNVSQIPDWLSDALCALATRAGFSTRRLYSNCEEVIINSMRPIMIGGIHFVPDREDYLDRSIFMNLPAIKANKRVPLEDLWKDFEMARPRILGALLDAVSFGLSNHHNIKLESYPRMADFARWIISSESAIGLGQGRFLEMYENNRRCAIEDSLEGNIVASAIRDLFGPGSSWKGTATELLKQLEKHLSDTGGKPGLLPKIASHLSGKLNRAQSDLSSVGIEIQFLRESGTGKKFITIQTLPPEGQVQTG